MQRTYLFLQGVSSPFFPRLADLMQQRGHRVMRVNFCAGDVFLWGRRPAVSYRGNLNGLPDFYQATISNNDVTDLVLFGDERPIHRPAIAVARRMNVQVHVFEEGYLRPDWFTLERGGVNANSALPRDGDWYRQAARDLKLPKAMAAPGGLRSRAAFDMAYHLVNVGNVLFYPRYRTHRPQPALIEYLGWARRFVPLAWYKKRDAQAIARACRGDTPFYLLPLQLNADTQITRHSPYRDMREVLEVVVDSFARHAPGDMRLVIKNHPLDTGLQAYRRIIRGLSTRLGLGDRVLYLETGHLPSLLNNARGTVVVNSTVGLSALHHKSPTITLGDAIYDLPGLTFQGPLDRFWTEGAAADRALLNAFSTVVRAHTQINGNLYTRGGIAMALQACAQGMELPATLPATVDRQRHKSAGRDQGPCLTAVT